MDSQPSSVFFVWTREESFFVKFKVKMVSLKEKVAYALGDAAAGGIVWKVMSIAFPLFLPMSSDSLLPMLPC